MGGQAQRGEPSVKGVRAARHQERRHPRRTGGGYLLLYQMRRLPGASSVQRTSTGSWASMRPSTAKATKKSTRSWARWKPGPTKWRTITGTRTSRRNRMGTDPTAAGAALKARTGNARRPAGPQPLLGYYYYYYHYYYYYFYIIKWMV